MTLKIVFVMLYWVTCFLTVKISGVVSLKVIELLIRLPLFGKIWQLYVEMNCLHACTILF